MRHISRRLKQKELESIVFSATIFDLSEFRHLKLKPGERLNGRFDAADQPKIRADVRDLRTTFERCFQCPSAHRPAHGTTPRPLAFCCDHRNVRPFVRTPPSRLVEVQSFVTSLSLHHLLALFAPSTDLAWLVAVAD